MRRDCDVLECEPPYGDAPVHFDTRIRLEQPPMHESPCGRIVWNNWIAPVYTSEKRHSYTVARMVVTKIGAKNMRETRGRLAQRKHQKAGSTLSGYY